VAVRIPLGDEDVDRSNAAASSSRTMSDEQLTVHRIRLRHADLAFHIDVMLTEKDGRWLATAMLADEPDIGVGDEPREALRMAALAALGEPWASELAVRARLPMSGGPAASLTPSSRDGSDEPRPGPCVAVSQGTRGDRDVRCVMPAR
jgi:hypothetical protein